MTGGHTRRRRGRAVRALAVAAAMTVLVGVLATAAGAQSDPRVGLEAGYPEAEEASLNVEHLARRDRAPGFDAAPNNFSFVNSDLALSGDFAFVGNYNGFQVYDISDPADPQLRTAVVCPGGQGDPSVVGDLLFISVEESRARTDCTTTSPASMRFQGVRVFDVSDIDNPVQVATVQTCRGSHTHTVVTDPDDDDNVYVYVSGTAGPRPASTMAGCNNDPADAANPSRWRIEVIKVPVDAPETAAVVNEVRLFTDPETGAIDGLQNQPPAPAHPSGTGWSPSPVTDACHDITAYPEIGLAAGACEGNGLLIDISDPENPVRLDAVTDPNYAYWHSATFNNDGTKVVFTDEWGGGTSPRCRPTDDLSWGANAIFDIVGDEMEFRSYYKMPAPQTNQENCVAHNGSLVPVPGRDILVQAWYQGGLSVMDFTDSSNPTEIAFFDRGPVNATSLGLGGFWAAYWYNGHIFGTEIARGFDSFALTASDQLAQAEIDAASEVVFDEFNPQHQPRLTWEPSFALVRSGAVQLDRADGISTSAATRLESFLQRAERLPERAATQHLSAAANVLRADARAGRGDAEGLNALADTVQDLADSMR